MATRPKAPISYAASLTVEDPALPASAAVRSAVITQSDATQNSGAPTPVQIRGRRPLEDKADPSVLYLHPDGKKALRLYAVERGVKVHDLLLEAVEQWAANHGLRGPWRVPSAGHPRRQRL